MTPIRIRKIAPIKIAITLVSPMVPAVVPRSIFIVSTLSPFFNNARGVAPVTPSYVKLVIVPAKETSRKHLPPSAGFIKFCPRPPNSIFTMTMANTLPSTACQTGRVWGRFSASRSPVTTALKSFTVLFLCISFSNAHSEATQVATHTQINTKALIPKLKIPNTLAGSSAIAT